MYFKMTRAAAAVVGGAAALCLGSVPAALAAPPQNTYFVPCNPYALHQAIGHARYGETLDLAPGCTYYLPGALPDVKTNLTIVGYHSTLTRTWDARSFSLLTVGGDCGVLDATVVGVTVIDDGCRADLTVINVNFTDGGGYGTYEGGAIDNQGGTLHAIGGTFSDNKTDRDGGAIYNDGQMTVSHATFTGNLAPYGGAIYNDDQASIYVSSFTWNKAPTLYGDPGNSDGGAIYNDDDLYLADSGFLANSTGGNGGAIYTDGTLRGDHITITANAADSDGGGIYDGGDVVDPAALRDSTVFGNQPDNCAPTGSVAGCFF
jgi:predicted outer membrane repeat protein